MLSSRTFATASLVLSLALTSCGGDGPGTTEPDPPRAAAVNLSTSSLSFTFLGQTLALTATVLDQFGQVFNTTVTWSTSDPTVATVTSGGMVTSVGNGTATITAAAGTFSGTATVTVQQVASRVSVISGNGQTGKVGTVLGEAVVVRSEDKGGAPFPGATVTFTVPGGGGSVSVASVTSDAGALASTTWTLGTTAGIQEITAVVAGSGEAGTPITATATASDPVSLAKTSGDQQSGTAGLALSEPVVVTVKDEFGNGVSGVAVTFAVTGGGGQVTPSQVSTGSDGTAQATWTMGAAVGANTLSASAGGLTTVAFSATAAAAKADVVPGTPVTDPENPTSLQSFEVTSTVTNQGHLPTGTGFRVQFLVDGSDAGSVNLPALAVGASSDATLTVGPLAGGSHIIKVVVDVDGAVDETDEGNNQAQTLKAVAASQLITAGTPVTGIGAAEGTEYLYTLEVAPSETGTLSVDLSGGTGDVDLYVHYGDRPAHRDDYECQSGNPDTNERCIFNAAEPGTYHILLYAWADFSGTTMLATTGGPVVPFDIEIVIIDHGTAEQDAAFQTAAARWMEIITSDIPSQSFAAQPVEADGCTEGQPRIDDEVDDIRIYVRIDSIDGSNGTLAQAGPCVLRGLKHHPVIGVMTFDEADLPSLSAAGAMVDVILHEMGHVLGLGTIWGRWELLRNPSLPNSSGVDTYFAGARAIDAFDQLGGASAYTLGEKVPVENLAESGSSDAHWRETVLGPELMTPGYNSGVPNPLSILTIASMADIGYRVDMTKADAFTRSYRVPQREAANRPPLDFGGDVRRGPIYVVDTKGGMREIRRR